MTGAAGPGAGDPSPAAPGGEAAAAIDRAVAAGAERAEAFLAELVAVPTLQPPGDLAGPADRIASLIEDLGLPVERIPVPEPFCRQHGMGSITDLLVRVPVGTGEGPTVALSAALDTAPPGEGWKTDPFVATRAGDRLHGCGVAGAKGNAAAFLFALEAFLSARMAVAEAAGTVELHLSFDDETGGYLGPQYLLAQGLVRPDRVIAAGPLRAVGTAQGGVLHLDVVVRGRQAHAAHREAGRDALKAAVPILDALYREEARLAETVPAGPSGLRPRLTVATISGGEAANLVPGRVRLRIDRRLTEAEDGEAVEAALAALVARAAESLSGLEVECQRQLLAEPVTDLARGTDLADLVARTAASVLGGPVPQVASGVLSGARFYAEAGIATVTFGVGPVEPAAGGAPHAPDESLSLADFSAARTVIACSLATTLLAR